MGNTGILAAFTDLRDRLYHIFTDPISLLLFTILLLLILVGFVRLTRNLPGVQSGLREFIERLNNMFRGGNNEARLNQVVCTHCKRGRGILNPVYVVYQDEPHIEGNCSHCGNFVRERLR